MRDRSLIAEACMMRMLLVFLVGLSMGAPALAQEKKRIVFVAGRPSHGPGDHEHNAGCRLLAKALNASGLPVEAVVHENGWPKDASIFDGAAAIVMYSDGGNGHMVIPNLKQVDALHEKGVGVGAIHY